MPFMDDSILARLRISCKVRLVDFVIPLYSLGIFGPRTLSSEQAPNPNPKFLSQDVSRQVGSSEGADTASSFRRLWPLMVQGVYSLMS